MEFLDSLSEEVKLTLTFEGELVVIDKIIAQKKNKGFGSDVMIDLTDWADDNGKTLAVTPTKDFGGSMVKLNRFFKKYGFEKNKKSDIEARLVRMPKSEDDSEEQEDD